MFSQHSRGSIVEVSDEPWPRRLEFKLTNHGTDVLIDILDTNTRIECTITVNREVLERIMG